MYAELLARNVADYRELYGRVNLKLPKNPDNSALSTNEQLKQFKKGEEDHGLIATYFQFGRYLLIASSRQGSSFRYAIESDDQAGRVKARNSRNIELVKHKIGREKAGKSSYTELAYAY